MGKFWDENVYPRAATLVGDEIFTIYQNAQTNTVTIDTLMSEFIQPSIDSISINSIGDVDTTTAVEGSVLIYSAEDSEWQATQLELNDLSDVKITNINAGDRIVYSSTEGKFVNRRNFYIGYYANSDAEIDTLKTIFQDSQQDIFDNWYRFSHDTNTEVQPANSAEVNSWTYNAIDDRVECTFNSNTYIGLISIDAFDTYTHEARLSSINADDDMIGIVIAFAVDGGGREHTLTALRTLGGAYGHSWAVIYNHRRTDAWKIADASPFIKFGNGFTGTTSATALGNGIDFQIRVDTITTTAYGAGAIATSTLIDGGSGYQINEQVKVLGGTRDAYVTILTVDGSGSVLTYYIAPYDSRNGTGFVAGITYDTDNVGYISNNGLGWSNTYPTGTLVNIDRQGDIITCNTTQLGEDVYVPSAELVIDLNSDPRLEIFKGPQRYGYSCHSQNGSYFSEIVFSGAEFIYDVRNGDAIYYEGNGSWVVHPTRTLFTDFVENTILYTETLSKAYLRAEDSVVVPFVI